MNLYIIAGPNGSGKTTFVERFLPRYADCINFVNADLIARGLSPFDPEIAAIKAGRIMLDQIEGFAEKGADFAFETTLSGKTYVSLLKRLLKKGYRVTLFFLWIRDIDLALKRIADRVAMGGHDVPPDVVKRRFSRGISNLFNVYRPYLHSWTLFDNSTYDPHLIVTEKNGTLSVVDDVLFELIRKSAETP